MEIQYIDSDEQVNVIDDAETYDIAMENGVTHFKIEILNKDEEEQGNKRETETIQKQPIHHPSTPTRNDKTQCESEEEGAKEEEFDNFRDAHGGRYFRINNIKHPAESKSKMEGRELLQLIDKKLHTNSLIVSKKKNAERKMMREFFPEHKSCIKFDKNKYYRKQKMDIKKLNLKLHPLIFTIKMSQFKVFDGFIKI